MRSEAPWPGCDLCIPLDEQERVSNSREKALAGVTVAVGMERDQVFECRTCDARLVIFEDARAEDLGPCPRCSGANWTRIVELRGSAMGVTSGAGNLTVKVGTATEREVGHGVDVALVDGGEAQEIGSGSLELGEEAVEGLGERLADYFITALLLLPPGPDEDPDDSWLVQAMLQGEWFPLGVGPVSDEIAEAMVLVEGTAKWWQKKLRGLG